MYSNLILGCTMPINCRLSKVGHIETFVLRSSAFFGLPYLKDTKLNKRGTEDFGKTSRVESFPFLESWHIIKTEGKLLQQSL